jgi:hypothetical protein
MEELGMISDENAGQAATRLGTRRGSTNYTSRLPLPSEEVNIEKALEVLRRIVSAARQGDAARAVTVQDVVSASGLRAESIQRCLGFFAAAGLLDWPAKGRPFMPTQHALDYEHLHRWAPDQATASLREAILTSEYGPRLKSLLSDDALGHGDFIRRLGLALEVRGSQEVTERKLRRLVEFLQHVGVIRLGKDGKLTLAEGGSLESGGGASEPEPSGTEEEMVSGARAVTELVPRPRPGVPVVPGAIIPAREGGQLLTFNFQLNINQNITPAEAENMAHAISTIRRALHDGEGD